MFIIFPQNKTENQRNAKNNTLDTSSIKIHLFHMVN